MGAKRTGSIVRDGAFAVFFLLCTVVVGGTAVHEICNFEEDSTMGDLALYLVDIPMLVMALGSLIMAGVFAVRTTSRSGS